MNVEVCCCVLLWSYLHLGRDHFADTTPATALVFSITSPSAISTMTVVSSAECIKGSLVWEVTQSYVKRAYGIGFNTYAWGNPHAHSCSHMLNWFQTLIWVYVMDPLIQFRVVWGWVRPGQRASLSQSSQRDLFIHARSDSHMAKFRLSSKPNIYIFGLWGQPRCPERPHTDQTGPGRPRDLNPGPVLL